MGSSQIIPLAMGSKSWLGKSRQEHSCDYRGLSPIEHGFQRDELEANVVILGSRRLARVPHKNRSRDRKDQRNQYGMGLWYKFNPVWQHHSNQSLSIIRARRSESVSIGPLIAD